MHKPVRLDGEPTMNNSHTTGNHCRRFTASGVTIGAAVLFGSLGLAGPSARAQIQATPHDPTGLAPQVTAMLDAQYLSAAERQDLRLFHGVWEKDDLDTPGHRAMAALIAAKLHDPSLVNPETPAIDRAEAALLIGEPQRAIDLLEGDTSFRAVRIRAQSLETLGHLEDAVRALEPALAAMTAGQLDAADLVEGVRSLMLRTQILGQEKAGGADFRVMMTLLSRARTLDKLYWPAHIAEAELLYDKANPREAQQAALETISLNPRCARAWFLLGQIAVDSFDFDAAEAAAAKLDELAGHDEADPKAPGSALADLVLARARIRQMDPDAAGRALQPTLRRFPLMRSALALEAAVAARRFDTALTQQLLDAYDTISPGSHVAYFAVGRTLSESRQYADAAKYLNEAARRRPMLAHPVIELGLLEMQSGRDIEALRALRRAAELDSFNDRAANSLELIEELITYNTVESEHFIVRYKPGLDEVLAPEMLPILDRIHARVAGTASGGFDHEPAVKTVIELMPDHRWFAVRITGMPGIHTIAAATGPVIAMERPQEGPGHSVGNYLWPRVIQHEYAHTVTLSRTRNRIPHWFTEAAAVYVEDAPRDYARAKLLTAALENDKLFALNEINFKFIRPEGPNDRAQAYAQGHWMYEYIVERFGPRAPLDLMDLYAQGDDEIAAFTEVLGISTESFMTDFAIWARAQAVSWGTILAEGVPSIEDLIRSARTAKAAAVPDGAEEPTPESDEEVVARMLDTWLVEHPDHPQLLEMALTRVLKGEEGGEFDASHIALLERYAKARPVDDMPHRHLARLYLNSVGGTPDDAIDHLEYLDARIQHTAAYAVALAHRYAANGDWTRARAKAERAVNVAPFDADYRELAAEVAIRSGQWQDALRHIEALTKIEPDRAVHQRRLEAIRKQMGGR